MESFFFLLITTWVIQLFFFTFVRISVLAFDILLPKSNVMRITSIIVIIIIIYFELILTSQGNKVYLPLSNPHVHQV